MGHFYQKNGKPLYEINKVGSKEKRDTNLADARKLSLVPSVTTITSIVAKPVLDKWKIDQLFLTVVEQYPKGRDEDVEKYKNRILPLYREKTEKAAKRGTEIHDKLESYFLTGKIDAKDEEIIVPALNLLAYEFNGQKWIPEESFAHNAGFGGKVDLYAKGSKTYSNGIILDFKTKAKDQLDKKSLYDDYCIQLAAYRLGLKIPKAKCYNLVISTTKPGTLYLHRWSEEELIAGLEKFQTMLKLWQLLNNYDSSWEIENE